MLIPELLPCELASSYARCLIALNGYADFKRGLTALRRHVFGEPTDQPAPTLIHTLARATGSPLDDFLRQHTLLPYVHAFSTHASAGEGKLGFADLAGAAPSGRQPKSGAHCCPKCVREDLDRWGFSFFRREHQLPGIDWCSKHRAPLVGHAYADPLRTSPDTLLASAPPDRTPQHSVFKNHSVIARYISLSEALLSLRVPIPLPRVIAVMIERAQLHDLRRAHCGTRTKLSDLALKQLPLPWIKSAFPEFYRDGKMYRGTLDGVFFNAKRPMPTKSYALALALLFESAEDALNAILNPAQPIQAKRPVQRGSRDFWASREFVDTYVAQQATCGPSSLNHDHTPPAMMTRADFPPAHQATEASLQALIEFGQGDSLSAACDRHGAAHEEVERLLRVAATRLLHALQTIEEQEKPPWRPLTNSTAGSRALKEPAHSEETGRPPFVHADPTEPQNVAQNPSSPPIKSSNLDIFAGSLERSAATAGATGAK